ncbi:hypothetical protein COAQ111491_05905 [Comamonas aquatilis]|uniref:hypothetical protein n=1 Tax=Comamonas aquatilis TaxID=1778406 RepID=UPI0039EEB29C
MAMQRKRFSAVMFHAQQGEAQTSALKISVKWQSRIGFSVRFRYERTMAAAAMAILRSKAQASLWRKTGDLRKIAGQGSGAAGAGSRSGGVCQTASSAAIAACVKSLVELALST